MTGFARDSRVSGLGWATVSAWSFALSGPLGRGLMDAGWSAAAAIAVRILIGAVVLVPFTLRALRGRWADLRRHLPLVTVFGLAAVAFCQFAYFQAVARMPVSVALLIEYTAPVPVVALMWLRHGQRPRLPTVLGAAVGAAGLVLVLDVTASGGLDPTGVLWAFGALGGVVCYWVLSAQDASGLPGVVLAAAGLLVGGAALVVAGLAGLVPLAATAAAVEYGGVPVPWWLPVLGLGVLTAALSYASGIAATRRLGSRLASFVGLQEVLAAMVLAWLMLGEVPTAERLLGGALVLAGIAVIRLGEPGPPVDAAKAPDNDHGRQSNPEGAVA